MDLRKAVRSAGLAWVEARCRLIEAEQGGLGAHGTRDLETPLGAIREVAGGIVRALGERNLVEPELGAINGLGLGVDVAFGAQKAQHRPSRDAAISALCWATIRFSSTVMPENRRMFWKVRATRARAAIS